MRRNSILLVALLALASLLAAASAPAAPTRIPQQTTVLNVLAAAHAVNHVTIVYKV